MDCLLKRIQRVWPELYLEIDNVHPYTTMLVQQFLAQKRVTVLHHPLYSPDLSPLIILHSRN